MCRVAECAEHSDIRLVVLVCARAHVCSFALVRVPVYVIVAFGGSIHIASSERARLDVRLAIDVSEARG